MQKEHMLQLQEIDQLNNKTRQVKNKQHNEILSNHNHDARNATYTRSNTNAI